MTENRELEHEMDTEEKTQQEANYTARWVAAVVIAVATLVGGGIGIWQTSPDPDEQFTVEKAELAHEQLKNEIHEIIDEHSEDITNQIEGLRLRVRSLEQCQARVETMMEVIKDEVGKIHSTINAAFNQNGTQKHTH